jgi:hypothetical protein
LGRAWRRRHEVRTPRHETAALAGHRRFAPRRDAPDRGILRPCWACTAGMDCASRQIEIFAAASC